MTKDPTKMFKDKFLSLNEDVYKRMKKIYTRLSSDNDLPTVKFLITDHLQNDSFMFLNDYLNDSLKRSEK